MVFKIEFTGEPDEYPHDDTRIAAAVGQIILGDAREIFLSTLAEWDKRTYIAQWRHSLRQLLDGSEKVSLITEYISPANASHLVWWPLYRGEAGIVHVQNHLLFYGQLDREFSVRDAASFIRERETIDEDGNKRSEWNVTLSDVALFLADSGP